MRNDLIFGDYDMVISFTQDTINGQIAKLVAEGTIKQDIILYRVPGAGGNYVYTLANSPGEIPQQAEYIAGNVTPSVVINQTGSTVTLCLVFNSGKAAFADKSGFGPLAKIQEYNMAQWKYGFNVNLDLSAFGGDKNHIASPSVLQQLNHFTSAQLSPDCLFLDFVSTDLKTTLPAATSCPAEMVLFMGFYFEHLAATGNPYILGYSINANAGSNPDADIPDTLSPTGTNYTVFYDQAQPGLSNLNYTLVTSGGHGAIKGTPLTLDSNWFTPSYLAGGKMIISHQCLLEALILEPFFTNLRQQVYNQLSQHMDIQAGNDYNTAKSVNGNQWLFTISANNSGDDHYCNSFTVTLPVGIDYNNELYVQFSGTVSSYKETSQNNFFCTARAWASTTLQWQGTIGILIGNGQLAIIKKEFAITSNSPDSGHNSCAGAGDFFGNFFGGILDVFTGWSDNGMFSNMLSNALSLQVSGIGDLSIGLDNFTSSISSRVMMPTGASYALSASPMSPTIDQYGNIYLDLDIK